MSIRTFSNNRLTDVINKNSSNVVINSYAYTYYSSGASTDLIQTETITNGEPIDNFVAGTTGYTPNTLNQLESTTNPNRTYGYDFDGNMTTGFTPEGYTLTMAYDAENRMKTAEYTDNQSVLHKTEYLYSGDSLLAEMKKYDGGSLTSTTKYLRAGFLPIQEREADNSLTREYVWGLNLGGGIGGLLNLRQNSNDYSYLYDGKGNVSSLINSSQSLVANYRYDSFGVLMKKNATIEQPYMFSTKPYDEKLGFIKYEYRTLMPWDGKWTTRDPIGERGGLNLYQMVGNNPLNWIDPFGLTQRDIDIAVELIKETQKDLIFPENVDPSMKSDKYAGKYNALTNTISLNENYLKELTDLQAGDLLDSIMHETLHSNDSLLKQLLDTFRKHKDIEDEAARRVREILERYLRERKIEPCKK